MKLTDEEKDLIESLERGEWQTVPNFEMEKARFQAMAAETLRRDQKVTVRLTERDLRHLDIRAAEVGLSREELMSSVLHRFANASSAK